MKIDILTLFPEMFAPLSASILGRAQKAGKIKEQLIRGFCVGTDQNPHGVQGIIEEVGLDLAEQKGNAALVKILLNLVQGAHLLEDQKHNDVNRDIGDSQ